MSEALEKARAAYLNLLENAKRTGVKLPPLNSNLLKEREGAFGFLLGFTLAWQAMDRVRPMNRGLVAANGKTIGENEAELFEDVKRTAKALFPDFDPPPAPIKRAEDGSRHDGLKME